MKIQSTKFEKSNNFVDNLTFLSGDKMVYIIFLLRNISLIEDLQILLVN